MLLERIFQPILLMPVVVAVSAAVACAADYPPHPRLLFNSEGIELLKQRIATCDWARAQWESTTKAADDALEREIDLPPRGGNWSHWYACPTHGGVLKTGKSIGKWQWQHTCPIGGEEITSDPSKSSTDYDACVISRIHGEWMNSVKTLGIVYAVTGDPRFARKAREIMLAYAGRYASYPLHNVNGEAKVGGGKMSSQTLDESVKLIGLCQGADLVWSTLSNADRDTIANGLLLPAVNEVILPHKMDIHNIQCWKNSAVGLVGLLLGDQRLVSAAIDDPERGYRVQLSKGVLPDGGWWEGSWGYHFYTMSALWPLAEAARNCGIDLYTPEYSAMFSAPLKFVMPGMRLPAFSDSREIDLGGESSIYEIGYARYRDPSFLPLLAGSMRRNVPALHFGVPDLPKAEPVSWKSANYPSSGYGILARGRGDRATWLCLKYGPYGGYHGHPDKLGFVLKAQGSMLANDPGTTRYGLPSQKGWYKTTLAHNTLTVDEDSQAAVDGRCIAFGQAGTVDYLVADAGEVYDGVRHIRAAALLDEGLVLFVDLVRADSEKLLELAVHPSGIWTDLPEGSSWTPPDKPGYKYLRDCTSRTVSEQASLTTTVASGSTVAITFAGGAPTEVITATGVGEHLEDRVPCAMFRRRGSSAVLAWTISVGDRRPSIELLKTNRTWSDSPAEGSAAAVRVRWNGGERVIAVNPDGQELSVLIDDSQEWVLTAPFATRDK